MENQNTLEWYMKNFRENCEACHERIVVHAFRAKGKLRKAIYGHCEKDGCRKKNDEIAYLGA
jgi:hypothetical protein